MCRSKYKHYPAFVVFGLVNNQIKLRGQYDN